MRHMCGAAGERQHPSLPFPSLPSGSSRQLGVHLSHLRPWEDSAAAKLPPLSPWPAVPGESRPGSGCREAAVSQEKGLGQCPRTPGFRRAQPPHWGRVETLDPEVRTHRGHVQTPHRRWTDSPPRAGILERPPAASRRVSGLCQENWRAGNLGTRRPGGQAQD